MVKSLLATTNIKENHTGWVKHTHPRSPPLFNCHRQVVDGCGHGRKMSKAENKHKNLFRRGGGPMVVVNRNAPGGGHAEKKTRQVTVYRVCVRTAQETD